MNKSEKILNDKNFFRLGCDQNKCFYNINSIALMKLWIENKTNFLNLTHERLFMLRIIAIYF